MGSRHALQRQQQHWCQHEGTGGAQVVGQVAEPPLVGHAQAADHRPGVGVDAQGQDADQRVVDQA